jgi:predicted TIM-barrel fold metal-dependent hydrolase
VEIIDSQVHVWGADTPERPWDATFGYAPHGPAEYTSDQALGEMDAAGVAAAIIVPPSFEGDRNDLGLAAAHAYSDRFRLHGRFTLTAPNAAEVIAKAMEDSAIRGVRLTFNGAAAGWIQDGTVDWFWSFAADCDVPVTLFPVGEQLTMLPRIAKRHPRLKLSIDHLATGIATTGFDTLDRIRALEPLAAYPNVAVKASALPIAFPATYSPNVVRHVVDLLMSWFGPSRIFWGSDFTRSKTGGYGDTLDVFLAGISHLPAAEQRLIMGGALREWFNWLTLGES